MSNNVGVEIKLNSLQRILADRGLETRGKVQAFIDSEVVRLSEPYVPFATGALAHSAETASDYGSGLVVWDTPYAAPQYYRNGDTKGLRGPLWFERMKADHLEEILDGAAQIAGGEATK